MKTTECDQEAIVELADASLTPERESAVRRHLEECSACREYLAEISELRAVHRRAAEQLPDAELPSRAYSRVRAAVRGAPDERMAANPARRLLRWAFGMAVGAGVLLFLAVQFGGWQAPAFGPRSGRYAVVTRTNEGSDAGRPSDTPWVSSQFLAYRRAMIHSDAEFDRVLNSGSGKVGWGAGTVYRLGGPRSEDAL